MSFSHDHLNLAALTMKDPDISLLVAQNETLSAELAQCQADKDFVWSLWKKLQVSNPDVTEAISLVIQREKEKSETKDRKVLEIIQVKDDRIEELQNIAAKQAGEFSDILSKKVEFAEKNSKLQVENDKLQEKVSSLQTQIKSGQSKERSLEDTFRKAVEGAGTEKYALNRKLAELTAELEVVKSEKAHAVSRQKILEERIRTLEKEVSDKMVKFEALVREVEDSTCRLTLYESQTLQQRRELEFKNQEMENIRRELRELWTSHNQLIEHSGQQADLIRQLQSLQQDTQKMMKNQEDAFCMESSSLQQMFSDVSTRYESSKRIESDLRQQVLELKKILMDKDDVISSLQSQQEAKYLPSSHPSDDHQVFSSHPDYNHSLLDILQEVDLIGKAGIQSTRSRGRSLNRIHDFENRNNYDHDIKRSRSLSPPTKDTESRLDPFDASKVAKLQKAYDLKSRQLEEMRKAHDKRLQRFQNLQASYRLAREDIKAMEFSRGKIQKKPKRADPRSLQKENSDQVWNELAFFKSENRILQVDKMSLQEEVDMLRVQASQDVASIHELKMMVQSQKEEYEFQLRSLRRESRDVREMDKQLSLLKAQVQNKTVHIGKLERDMINAIGQRDDLMQEKSKLISQLTSTQQEASKYRIELADTKHQLQSLRHEFEDLQRMSHIRDTDDNKRIVSHDDRLNLVHAVASSLMTKKKKRTGISISKEYQKNLHCKVEETPVLDNCIDEEWEEVSDCGGHSESECEPPRFGRTFTKRSHVRNSLPKGLQKDNSDKRVKQRRVPTHRPPQSKSNNQSPERPASSSKSSQWIHGSTDHVSRREFATSPIAFINPTSSSSFALTSIPAPSQRHRITPAAATNRFTRRPIESRQMVTLRHRVFRLQQHMVLLKKAKMSAIQSEKTLTETVATLKAELFSVQGRLKAAKQNIQKLQADQERLKKEKQEMDGGSALKTDRKTELSGDGQEVKILEAKLKAASSEASKQSASVRTMKVENESLQEQVRNLQDRINHLERDLNQKRNLLESQRAKLKQVQDVSKSDADNVEELQTRNKLLMDSNNKMKVQLDSLKKRLTVIMKEKREYEDKAVKVSLELDNKNKVLQEVSTQKINLELALTDLETSAHQQLHGLAAQSEAAIDVAKEKLMAAQARLTQFCSVVKVLATELVSRMEQTRSRLRESKITQENSHHDNDLSLQRAQDKARDILNLSYSDIEDIMSADGDRDTKESTAGEEKKLDKRWLRKCEKLISCKDDFAQPLVSLLLQKVDERADLLLQLSY